MKQKLLLLLVALLPLVASAYDAKIDGIYYNFISENEAEVTYKNYLSASYSGVVAIPRSVTYNGKTYSVTSIGEEAFFGCSGLTSITIPNSVISIGEEAFSGCGGLTSITLHCKEVGSWFSGLSSIQEIILGEEVISIGENAFKGCNGLTSITIPNSVTSIGNHAFEYCTDLTSVTIPESVTSIGWSAFNGCSGLSSVNIPNSVTSIGMSSFYGCTGLTSVTIPESVTSIGWSAFNGCSGLISVIIGSGVTNIGRDAFFGCSSLADVWCYPKNVPQTNSGAFRGTPIESATLHVPEGTVDAYGQAYPWREFKSIVEIGHADVEINGIKYNLILDAYTAEVRAGHYTSGIVIPSAVEYEGASYRVVSIGEKAFFDCSTLTSVDIPEGVVSIGRQAFYKCTNLRAVTLPSTLTTIGYSAFDDCYALSAIDIPSGVTFIDGAAFSDCRSLTSLVLPDGIPSVGDWFCDNCTGLTSITIPGSVTSIGNYAFYGCSGLTSISIQDGVTSIGSGAFSGCTSLQCNEYNNACYLGCDENPYVVLFKAKSTDIATCEINEACKIVYEQAFSGCGRLTSAVFPDGIVGIGYRAFYNCYRLPSLTIPESVTSIGTEAFYNCYGLTSIHVESGNSSYDSRDNCNALIETETNAMLLGCNNAFIPASVTSIGASAFRNCIRMSSLTIPKGVTSIGEEAFYNCGGGLTSINVESGNTVYDSRDNCNALIETETNTLLLGCNRTVIPDGVTCIGQYAFMQCIGLTTFIIPEGVTTIENNAFGSCRSLTIVSIPSTISYIGYDAFLWCNLMTDVYCYADNLPETWGYPFNGMSLSSVTLHVPAASIDLYRATEPWSEFGNIVRITDEDAVKEARAAGDTPDEAARYDIQGRRIDKSHEGLNIIRYSDGTSRKVIQ